MSGAALPDATCTAASIVKDDRRRCKPTPAPDTSNLTPTLELHDVQLGEKYNRDTSHGCIRSGCSMSGAVDHLRGTDDEEAERDAEPVRPRAVDDKVVSLKHDRLPL